MAKQPNSKTVETLKHEQKRKNIPTAELQSVLTTDDQQTRQIRYGQGLQRHLIFTLLMVASGFAEAKPASIKKEFAPELTILLFEEPEVFLHPQQQAAQRTNPAFAQHLHAASPRVG